MEKRYKLVEDEGFTPSVVDELYDCEEGRIYLDDEENTEDEKKEDKKEKTE